MPIVWVFVEAIENHLQPTVAIKGIKNIKKSKMVDKIVNSYRSRQVYNKITRQQNKGNNNNAPPAPHPSHKRKYNAPFKLSIFYSLMLLLPTLPPLATLRTGICLIGEGLEMTNYFGLAFSGCSFVQLDPEDFDNLSFLNDDVFEDRITLILERLFCMTGRSLERLGKVSMQTIKLH
jgi:hypothetical protein